MTVPYPGLWRDEYHRYYYGNRLGPFPGVTSVAGIVDKSGPLVGWAKRQVAASAVRNLPELTTRAAADPYEAEGWLASIPDLKRDAQANLGSGVHDLASKSLSGAVLPTDDERPYVEQYFAWQQAMQPTILYSEQACIDTRRGYGGTFDLGVLLSGIYTLIDIKTSRNVYDESALQLAGYASCPSIGRPDDPQLYAMPGWQRFAILHLTQSSWELVPMVVDRATIGAFDAALALYRWNQAARAGQVRGVPIRSAVVVP